MKTLKLYITEALHVNRNTKGDYHNYRPKTNYELKKAYYEAYQRTWREC